MQIGLELKDICKSVSSKRRYMQIGLDLQKHMQIGL